MSAAFGLQHDRDSWAEDHELPFGEGLAGGFDFSCKHEGGALEVFDRYREAGVRLQHDVNIHQVRMHRYRRALSERRACQDSQGGAFGFEAGQIALVMM